jgi:hypothetical protein
VKEEAHVVRVRVGDVEVGDMIRFVGDEWAPVSAIEPCNPPSSRLLLTFRLANGRTAYLGRDEIVEVQTSP